MMEKSLEFEDMSYFDQFRTLLGFQPKKLVDTETEAPIVFTYSLYYVYYD